MAPDHVVYVSTLSKVFAPGLRIGFCVAPQELRKWLVVVKQGVDLHTSTFSQALAAEYLVQGHLDAHLPKIINLYKPRQEAMLAALDRYFPTTFKWSRPQGGMFIWAQGPRGMCMISLYRQAIREKVAFVPGMYFYAHQGQGQQGQGQETMRLNFSMCDETRLALAVKTLAGVIDKTGIGA
jgi:2-aminoadipate transaminase